MAFTETIVYDSASYFAFDSTLVEVSGGTIRLKDLGGATYSTANPAVTTQHRNMLSTLTSFSESASKPAGTEIKYVAVINGSNYYYSSTDSTWETSDGTYTQSNTATEINAHASTLHTALSLTSPFYLTFKIFLHSDTGVARPTLTNTVSAYTFTNSSAVAISECLIYCYLKDLLGNLPTYNANYVTTLNVFSDEAFFHGSAFIAPFTKSVNFDSNGYAEISIIETTTPGVDLSFNITQYDGISKRSTKLFNALIPNTATSSLSNISQARPYDFG